MKTLKDTVLIEHLTEAQQEELRGVAKEWINNDALLGDENHISPEVKQWIKHFFNLEEEE